MRLNVDEHDFMRRALVSMKAYLRGNHLFTPRLVVFCFIKTDPKISSGKTMNTAGTTNRLRKRKGAVNKHPYLHAAPPIVSNVVAVVQQSISFTDESYAWEDDLRQTTLHVCQCLRKINDHQVLRTITTLFLG